jgi:hypothetical protein
MANLYTTMPVVLMWGRAMANLFLIQMNRAHQELNASIGPRGQLQVWTTALDTVFASRRPLN